MKKKKKEKEIHVSCLERGLGKRTVALGEQKDTDDAERIDERKIHTALTSAMDFPGGWAVNNLPAMQEKQIRSLGQEDPLETKMATHSRILAWEIQWQRSLAGYSPRGRKRVGHDLATKERQPPHAALEQFLSVSPTQKLAAITQIASAMG